MRQMYETAADLACEQEVASRITAAWDCSLRKLPIRYHLDFAVTRGDKLVGFCEIKTRNYTMQQIDSMGGYLMSIGKWEAARNLSYAADKPFVLAVKTTDGIWYSSVYGSQFVADDVLVRGRTDRGDWQDIEPCVLLDCNRFKRLQ